LFGELRVHDKTLGEEILTNIQFAENGAFQTTVQGEPVLIEAFDEPLVAQFVQKKNSKWLIQLPYNIEFEFDPKTLTTDEWDRFHGKIKGGMPFVLSRKAQANFFDQLDEFDDDSITIDNKKITLQPWLLSKEPVETEKFWSTIYQTETPGWEMNQPTPILVDMLPRMKIPPSRVIVLGCGSGNDAAYFAEHGHFVTAVDISPEAIKRAKEKYQNLPNLKFVQADVFKLPEEFNESFDLVFEHTCYCAIDPQKRNDLVKTWRRLLHTEGHLLGVFFTMEKTGKPPFGGSEWEIRERLKKGFQFIFWSRWQKSIERRNGKELLVYATKRKI